MARDQGYNPAELSQMFSQGRAFRGWTFKYDALEVLEGEIWINLDSRRLISSFGRLAHLTKTGEMIESHTKNQSDYLSVQIDRKSQLLHRAVVHYFGSDEDRHLLSAGYDVDHKDGDTKNNKIDNLQVLSRREHAEKTFRVLKGGRANRTHVRVLNVETNVTRTFQTIPAAATFLRVSRGQVVDYIKGRKRHRTYQVEQVMRSVGEEGATKSR
jgi:hypothetical protein